MEQITEEEFEEVLGIIKGNQEYSLYTYISSFRKGTYWIVKNHNRQEVGKAFSIVIDGKLHLDFYGVCQSYFRELRGPATEENWGTGVKCPRARKKLKTCDLCERFDWVVLGGRYFARGLTNICLTCDKGLSNIKEVKFGR